MLLVKLSLFLVVTTRPFEGILRHCILGSWKDGVSDETKAEAIDALQALPESIPQMCVRACVRLGCARARECGVCMRVCMRVERNVDGTSGLINTESSYTE